MPNSGTYLVQRGRSQLIEAYEVRRAIESAAVAKIARRPKIEVLDELHELCSTIRASFADCRKSGIEVIDRQQWSQSVTLDMAFHLLLLKAAGNYTAFRITSDLFMLSQIHGYRSRRHDLYYVRRVWLQHAAILRAIRQGDARSARRWLRQHLRDSLQDALATFRQEQSGSAPGRGGPGDFSATMDDVIAQIVQAAEASTNSNEHGSEEAICGTREQ